MGILSENGMSLLVECEDCRDKFEINSKNGTMHFKRKYEINGQTIFLSYYDCPKCNRRHYAQIDSTKTLNEMREIEHQIAKLAAAKKKGKMVPQKQSAKFKKSREHLTQSRNELMKQYTGKLIHDSETDTDFELRFSV